MPRLRTLCTHDDAWDAHAAFDINRYNKLVAFEPAVIMQAPGVVADDIGLMATNGRVSEARAPTPHCATPP